MSDPIFQNSKYRFIRKISEGSSGYVFLVEANNTQFAFKSIKSQDQASLMRFRRESSTLARLSHPNLVKIFDSGEQNNLPYIVMEYVEGLSLQIKLKKEGHLSENETIKIITNVVEALGEIHTNNLVHRDIKPSNILISKDGAKLIDLSLVGDIDQIKNETALVGTPLYCSPEQTKILNRNVSFSSDLYSLGIVFFEMLTGSPPFTGDLNEILQQQVSIPVPNLRILKPKLRLSIVAIIEKLLSKDPDDRYQNTLSLLHDIKSLDEIDSNLSLGKGASLNSFRRMPFATKVKFVERGAETQKLNESWAVVKNGEPGIFIVKGPSGSGKTRFCTEFVTSVTQDRPDNILILRGKSQLFNRHVPFGVIREAISSLMDSISAASPEDQSAIYSKLAQAAEGHETNLIKLSKSLERAFKKTIRKNIETDIEGERDKFFGSIADFFKKLSQQFDGLILLIDDLQWIDSSSIQLLDRIVNQSDKTVIFVIGTARNDKESEGTLKSLVATLGSAVKNQLELSEFNKEQMSDLLSMYLGANKLNSEIVDLFFSKSNGNPFVVTEYLRAALEQGFLSFKNGDWQIERQSLQNIAFSQDVYELIIKRIDASSMGLKLLLQYAALYGNSFIASDIAEVAGIKTSNLIEILDEGERLGLIDRLSAQKWKFSHDKISESLRQSTDPDLHKKKCDELSSFLKTKSNKTDEEIYILALLIAAGDYERNLEFAVEANIEAGLLSITHHAHSQAFIFLKWAYELSKKMSISRSRIRELLTSLTICATMVSEWATADECVQKVVEQSKSNDELKNVLLLKIWAKKVRGDLATAWQTFRKASECEGSPYPSYLQWKLLNILWLFFANILMDLTAIRPTWFFPPNSKRRRNLSRLADLYREGQFCGEARTVADSLFISLKILFIGQVLSSKREMALGFASAGYAFATLGITNLAIPFFNKANRLSDEMNDPVVRANCIAREISGRLYCGDAFDQTKEFEKHFDIMNRYLNPLEFGRVRNLQVHMMEHKGYNREALDLLSSFLNMKDPDSSNIAITAKLRALHMTWYNLGVLGRVAEAQKVKQTALTKNSPYRYVPYATFTLALYETLMRSYNEEVDELTSDLREKISAKYSLFFEMTFKIMYCGSVFVDLCELEKAKSLEEAFSIRKRFKANMQRLYFGLYSPLFKVSYFLLKARYYRIKKKYRKVKRWLAKTEEAACRTGNIRIMFEVQREWARFYLEANSIVRMQIHLASALRIAEEHQWRHAKEALQAEFGEFAERILAFAGNQLRPAASLDSSSIVMQPSTASLTHQSSMPTSHSTQTNRGVEIEDFRFVDALLKVSNAFVSSLDKMEQSKAVLIQIVKLFAAERGFVFVKHEEKDTYDVLCGKDAQGGDISNLTGFSSTFVKKALNTSETIIAVSSDEAQASGSESAVLYNLRSIFVTPLVVKNRVLGAVYLDSSLTKGLFTKRDAHLFSTLVNHISVAFELSRMAKVELEKNELRKRLEIQEAVASESKKVQILVENMQQSLFSVASDGTIIEPVSKYSEKMFGQDIVGHNLFDTLYKSLPGESEKLDITRSAMQMVFGEDEIQWSLSEANFPRRVASQAGQIFKILPSPIWDKENKLERILFVVEDATHLEALEQQARHSSVRAMMLEDIIENQSNDLQEFFESSEKTIKHCRKLNSTFNPDDFNNILRDLHSMKGNARLFRMRRLSDQIHSSESALSVFKDNPLAEKEHLSKTMIEIDSVEEVVVQYRSLLEKLLSSHENVGGGSGVSEIAINQLKAALNIVERRFSELEIKKIERAIGRLRHRSLREGLTRFEKMVYDLSEQLDKKAQLMIVGDTVIDVERLRLLQECVLHFVRNSLDHGIETASDRLRNGKPETGVIQIKISEKIDSLEIAVIDDGRGIDANQVSQKAIEKGFITEDGARKLSDKDKIEMILMPHFSTMADVNDISGRGIGMDIVRKNIEKLGGNLRIETKIGQGSYFTITLKNEDLEKPIGLSD